MSPAFRFNLDRVLRVRRLEEEVARARWLEAQHESARAQVRLERARAAGREAGQQLHEQISRPLLTPAAVLSAQAACSRIEASIGHQAERALTAAFQAEQQRAPWQEKRSETRGLESLRGRRLENHQLGQERIEIEQLNEIAGQRHARGLLRHDSGPRESTHKQVQR
jgi:flagellar export protein FliJ